MFRKVSINSRLKAVYIKGWRKAFCRLRFQESRSARKEAVNTDILIACRNDDRKIMQ